MWNRVPQPVRRLVEELEGLGGVTALVGGCVRDLTRGAPVRDWDVATAVEPQAVLEHFARAVPTGLRFGTVMLPTPAGPVDVTRLRGPNLAADLARRDFTINAMALSRGAAEPDDPHGGAADFAARRLRAVGAPEQRLAEDPLRALRAARFRAELGLVPDAPLERAMAGIAARLPEVAGERVRAEVDRLLVAQGAPAAITLLRRCGIEAVIVPGARSDVARVVEHLPPDRSLRLAAWLRGVAKPGRVLARLRLGSERRREVEALLALHPVDRHVGPAPRALRRLLRRMGEEGTQQLLALRRAELDGARPEDFAPLARLEAGLDAVRAEGPLALRRRDLALSGAQVMAALGCGPGPRVGRALGHLLDCVLDDPACNTEAALRERLERFAAQDG